jgi:hypothetical protein
MFQRKQYKKFAKNILGKYLVGDMAREKTRKKYHDTHSKTYYYFVGNEYKFAPLSITRIRHEYSDQEDEILIFKILSEEFVAGISTNGYEIHKFVQRAWNAFDVDPILKGLKRLEAFKNEKQVYLNFNELKSIDRDISTENGKLYSFKVFSTRNINCCDLGRENYYCTSTCENSLVSDIYLNVFVENPKIIKFNISINDDHPFKNHKKKLIPLLEKNSIKHECDDINNQIWFDDIEDCVDGLIFIYEAIS